MSCKGKTGIKGETGRQKEGTKKKNYKLKECPPDNRRPFLWQLPAQGKEGLQGVAAELLPLIPTLHIDLDEQNSVLMYG